MNDIELGRTLLHQRLFDELPRDGVVALITLAKCTWHDWDKRRRGA
nr:hypothetical protein [uncultured Rhodococcus sp.]